MVVKEMSETCSNCEWYADKYGVCCNGYSEWAADFRDKTDTCMLWEEKHDKS